MASGSSGMPPDVREARTAPLTWRPVVRTWDTERPQLRLAGTQRHVFSAGREGDMPEAEEELEARKKARTEGPDKSTEAHAAALLKLHAWYREWSETARSVITRRDYLIRLGLAKRKGRRGEGPAPE